MRRRLLCLIVILAAALALGSALPAAAQDAYCNINSVKYSALTNGVQLSVKSDGILVWDWENSWDARRGSEVSTVSIRFASARLQLEKTLYDVDQEPVSNLSLFVPQNAPGGRGVVLTVNMTQPSKVKADLSEDRQTFLLTVYGTRTVERAGGAKEGDEESLAGTTKVTADSKGLVSVLAVKADIHKVVTDVARCGNVSVAVDDAVQRKVSLNLQNLPALAIIKGIAAGYGLALSNVGDVYMLSEGVPTDLPTYLRSGTASFPTKYLKAADAKTLLPTFLFKYVHDNPEQNAVVVTAPTQMLDKIRRDLQAVDVPPPMIMVECAVVELTDASDVDTQFRWLY
ncbi:MAG: secretin N-terminal domain-containing protein, partial [Armatimonadota bacterium]